MTVNLHAPMAQLQGPTADTLAGQVELLLRAVEAEVAAAGWGQSPIYGTVWQHEPGRVAWASQLVTLDMLAMAPEDVLSGTLAVVEQPLMAHMLASSARNTPAGTRFIATAVLMERAALIVDLDDPASVAREQEYARYSAERRVAEHPDAQLCRVLFAAFGDGRVVCLGRTQHGPPEYNDGGDGSPAIQGVLSDTLVRLAQAFTRAEAAGRS